MEGLTRELTQYFEPNSEVVSVDSYYADIKRYGDQVSLGHLVASFREKEDGDGNQTTCRVRLCYADSKQLVAGPRGSGQTTGRGGRAADRNLYHSGCADSASDRITTQIGLQHGARQITEDNSGAYWKGKPRRVEDGGRRCYAFIPKWLTEVNPSRYPQWDPITGRRNIILVTGNMPGRRDAGKIWGDPR